MSTEMPSIVDFLRARITEDEVSATLRECHTDDCQAVSPGYMGYTYPCECGVPERMAKEAQAKRELLKLLEVRCSIDGVPAIKICSILASIYNKSP